MPARTVPYSNIVPSFLTPASRTSIIRKTIEILEARIDEDVKLISVKLIEQRRRLRSHQHDAASRFLQSNDAPYLPLAVRVNAPEDVSDFAMPYIIEILSDSIEDLHDLLRLIDDEVFAVRLTRLGCQQQLDWSLKS